MRSRGRSKSGMSSAGRGSPRRNRIAHVLFAVVVAVAIVFVLTRNESSQPDSGTTSIASTVLSGSDLEAPTTTSSRATTTRSAEVLTSVTAVTTSPPEEFEVLSADALSYIKGLEGFKETLHAMVVRSNATNSDWNNREEAGAGYRETESVLADVVRGLWALEQALRDQEVPPAIQGMHQGPDGPIDQAGRLVTLAQAVLEGLQLPAPDDGSTRREALADFNAGADEFNLRVDGVIRHLEENAAELGLATRVATTTTTSEPGQDSPVEATTTTQPGLELSAEAISYVEGLVMSKAVVEELLASSNAANLAWDSTEETGVTYRETGSALVEVLEKTAALRAAVQNHSLPDGLEARGQRVIDQAAGLVAAAEAVLEGLRIPAPEDGSVRRATLADFNMTAADFVLAADEVISYIQEHAGSLGLLERS